jgi:membrane-associated phospholipid phosphatase
MDGNGFGRSQSEAHWILHFRLEDLIALVFFLFTLSLQVISGSLREISTKPADVLIIIPAVALLLVKELVHYFLAGKEARIESAGDLREFVRPYWEIVRDWFPFLVILMMYYSLWGDATHLLVTHDRDAQLIALDQKLFGLQASVAIQRIVSPPLTAWMQFAYAFHLWNIPLVACFIYLRRPRQRFREMMSGLIAITFFGLLGYLLVPAIGPMYTLSSRYTVPLVQPLAVLNQQISFMDLARIRRDCFPSLHVGISFVVWLYAWRNSKRLALILAPLVLSLWVSTVYLRYHYLIDCVAGFIVALLCFWLANELSRHFGEVALPIRVPRFLRAGSPTPRGVEELPIDDFRLTIGKPK